MLQSLIDKYILIVEVEMVYFKFNNEARAGNPRVESSRAGDRLESSRVDKTQFRLESSRVELTKLESSRVSRIRLVQKHSHKYKSKIYIF